MLAVRRAVATDGLIDIALHFRYEVQQRVRRDGSLAFDVREHTGRGLPTSRCSWRLTRATLEQNAADWHTVLATIGLPFHPVMHAPELRSLDEAVWFLLFAADPMDGFADRSVLVGTSIGELTWAAAIRNAMQDPPRSTPVSWKVSEDAMDPAEKKALEDIERFGCHVIHVLPEGDLPGFSYSIGVGKSAGAPEVIVLGLDHKVAHSVVNDYNIRVRAGERFATGLFYDGFLEGFDVTFERVDPRYYRDHLCWARWLHKGDGFEAVQLVYPTTSGVWPWDPTGPDLFGTMQPLLTASGGREAG